MGTESNSGAVKLRLAELADADKIAAVMREAFDEYRPLYTQQAFAATTPTSKQIEARMQEGPVWVAIHSGEIVGTVAAVPRGQDFYIRGMAALPASRGVRIGQALLGAVEGAARSAGHRRLILSTTPFLTRAIRLYERFGFRRSNQGPHDLFGTPLFTMIKWLETSETDSSNC